MVDPFPLLHLSDLNFTITQGNLSSLPASSLLLAQSCSTFNETLSRSILREFRRRREARRDSVGELKEMGIFAGRENRQKEYWFGLECISYDFDISGGVTELTSAQLLVLIWKLHIQSTVELAELAEDEFVERRERDFAAGLSLPILGDSTESVRSHSIRTVASIPPPSPSASTLISSNSLIQAGVVPYAPPLVDKWLDEILDQVVNTEAMEEESGRNSITSKAVEKSIKSHGTSEGIRGRDHNPRNVPEDLDAGRSPRSSRRDHQDRQRPPSRVLNLVRAPATAYLPRDISATIPTLYVSGIEDFIYQEDFELSLAEIGIELVGFKGPFEKTKQEWRILGLRTRAEAMKTIEHFHRRYFFGSFLKCVSAKGASYTEAYWRWGNFINEYAMELREKAQQADSNSINSNRVESTVNSDRWAPRRDSRSPAPRHRSQRPLSPSPQNFPSLPASTNSLERSNNNQIPLVLTQSFYTLHLDRDTVRGSHHFSRRDFETLCIRSLKFPLVGFARHVKGKREISLAFASVGEVEKVFKHFKKFTLEGWIMRARFSGEEKISKGGSSNSEWKWKWSDLEVGFREVLWKKNLSLRAARG